MKTFFLIVQLVLIQFAFSQPATEGMTTYVNLNAGADGPYTIDSSYHIKFREGKWAFFDKDSNQIFNDWFVDYPRNIGLSFFIFKDEKTTFLLSPKTKRKVTIDKKYAEYYDYYDVKMVTSFYSHDTLITLKKYYINLKNEIVIPGENYSEIQNKNKKYSLKSDDDMYLEDQGQSWQELDSAEFDADTKEIIFVNKNKNHFFVNQQFEDFYPLYDYITYANQVSAYTISERFYTLKKNGKYGVVSSLGKIILPFEFSKISCVNQEHLMMFKIDGSYLKARRNNQDEIYDLRGKYLFSQNGIDDEGYIDSQGNFYYGYYEGFHARKKDKVSLISMNGTIVLPPIYDYYDFFDFKKRENLYTISDYKQSTSCYDYAYNQYFIGLNRKSKINHFYAPNGKFLNSISFDGMEMYNQDGFVTFYNDDKYGLIGPGACVVIEAKYDYISLFQGKRNIFAISTDTSSYFVNEKLEPLFGPNVHGSFVDSTYAIVTKNGRTGVIDVLKSVDTLFWVIPAKYDFIEAEYPYDNKNTLNFRVKIDENYGMISLENQTLYPIEYQNLMVKNGILISKKNSLYGLGSYLGKEFLKHEFDKIEEFNSPTFKVKKDNKYFIFSTYLNKQTSKEYQEIEKIHRNYNHYLVKQNNKYGIINFSHEEIIPTIYKLIHFDEVSKEFECYKENGEKDCFFVK